MNIEYMNLDNNITVVTNENGEILKRLNNISDKELLIENKIEKIDDKLEQIKKKVFDYEGLIFVSNSMLISQFFILIATAIFGHIINGLYGLIYAISFCLALCCVNSLFWGIVNPVAKRKLKGSIAKLEKAKDLKRVFLEELEKEKKKTLEDAIIKNEVISLKHKNSFEFSQIDKDLDDAYSEAVHSKPKKLTLKK